MLNTAILLTLAIPLGLMVRHGHRYGARAVVLSHFWYLTLIWLVCFPLRAIAWQAGDQTPVVFANAPPTLLAVALMVAFAGWVVVWVGYMAPSRLSFFRAPVDVSPNFVLMVSAALSAVFLGVVVATLDVFSSVTQGGYFTQRIGAGHLFLAPELFVYASIIGSGVLLKCSPRIARLVWAFVAVALVIAAALTVITVSRRMVAVLILAVAIISSIRYPGALWVAALAMVSSIVAAPILQSLRRLLWDQTSWAELLDPKRAVSMIFHTYEGLEHVAAFIASAGWRGMLMGVDKGESWLFNLGLALVPRAVWSGKPLSYGNVAQQEFLHPDKVIDGVPTITLPPSFVVDFLFGFGIVGGVILAVGLGVCLRRLEIIMCAPKAAMYARIFAVFVFAHMFAVVRSGTGFVQVLVMFAAVLVLVYGSSALVTAVAGRFSRR